MNVFKLWSELTTILNEGRGEDASGFMDTLVDRLFHYIGEKEIRNVCCPVQTCFVLLHFLLVDYVDS